MGKGLNLSKSEECLLLISPKTYGHTVKLSISGFVPEYVTFYESCFVCKFDGCLKSSRPNVKSHTMRIQHTVTPPMPAPPAQASLAVGR